MSSTGIIINWMNIFLTNERWWLFFCKLLMVCWRLLANSLYWNFSQLALVTSPFCELSTKWFFNLFKTLNEEPKKIWSSDGVEKKVSTFLGSMARTLKPAQKEGQKGVSQKTWWTICKIGHGLVPFEALKMASLLTENSNQGTPNTKDCVVRTHQFQKGLVYFSTRRINVDHNTF